MSIQIRNIGLSQPDNSKGYIEHATIAGLACLEKSGIGQCAIGKDEIDLLINVGNYRDNNMCEPSMAVLIQHALGINLNPLTHPVKAHTFSFDLLNGTGGLLNALQVADAILSTKGGRYALLVSGDTHPSTREHAEFPFDHSSAALLIEQVDTGGFSNFAFQSTPKFQGTMGHLDLDIHGLKSRTSVIVEGTYDLQTVMTFTTTMVSKYIAEHHVDTENTVMIVVHSDASLAKTLSTELHIPLAVPDAFGHLHTAGVGFALDKALQTNQASNILCVTVSSGITVGCTLYERTL